MDNYPCHCCNSDLPAVGWVIYQTAGYKHRQRKTDKLLQFSQPAKLSQHNFAKNNFAQRRTNSRIEWMKQNAKRQRNKSKILY
ncbi:hypothetical protein D3C80_1736230 [compost metagenome]